MNKEKQLNIFSSDQGVFSQWDQIPKDGAVLRALPGVQIQQNFHGSDTLGRQSVGDHGKFADIHVTTEHFGQDASGHEFAPAWFAVSDAMPFLTKEYMNPAVFLKVFATKTEALITNAIAAKTKLTPKQREHVEEILQSLNITSLPESVNEGYRQLTEGNWMGLVDEGRRSASSYHMSEILPAQRQMMLRLYKASMKILAPEARQPLKERFEKITRPGFLFSQEMFEQTLPNASSLAFKAITQQLEQQTGIDYDRVLFDESSHEYRLPKPEHLEERKEHFTFLNWYLHPGHRDIYDSAHNESGKIMTQGINPMASGKGETPFWIIINGKRDKLYLTASSIQLGDRRIALSNPVRSAADLSQTLYQTFGDAKISVIPTAIGYIMQMRANGSHLLPEKGSSYIPQVDLVYDLMRKKTRPGELKDIRPYPTLRVHPHALSAIPTGYKIKLPVYLQNAFPADSDGYTTTQHLKEQWQAIVAKRQQTLNQAKDAKTLKEKALILFADSSVEPLIADLLQQAENNATLQQEAKNARSQLMTEIRQRVGNNNDLLRAVGEFMAGKRETLGDLQSTLGDLTQEAQRLKAQTTQQGSGEHLQAMITYLAALQYRNLAAGIEALGYFDVRPSLMTMYLMFGEEGVKNLINTSEVYLEMLGGEKRSLTKDVTVVNGNRLIFVDDRDKRIFTVDSLRRFNEEQALRMQLIANNADSAIILTHPEQARGVKMLVLEKDGSYSEFCGNAAREIVHIYGNKDITIETRSGQQIHALKKDGQEVLDIPVITQNITDQERIATTKLLGNIQYQLFTAAGEPHLVLDIRTSQLGMQAFEHLGLKLQDIFQQGVNVDFVMEKEVAVFERGANDFTGSCGTGASSIANFLHLQGKQNIQFVHPKTGERHQLTITKEGEKTYLQV